MLAYVTRQNNSYRGIIRYPFSGIGTNLTPVRQQPDILKHLTGLGVFQGERCYDPDRPWWLPGFINTPHEALCLTGDVYGREGIVDAFSGRTDNSYPAPNPGPAPAVPSCALTWPYDCSQQQVVDAQRTATNEWRAGAIPDTAPRDHKWLLYGGLLIGGLVVVATRLSGK